MNEKAKNKKLISFLLAFNPGVIGINFFNWILKLNHATVYTNNFIFFNNKKITYISKMSS
jgi:hypothetical protein